MEDMIRIEDLVFEYTRDEDQQPVSAIRNVSLNIEKGSFTAIIGRNGSGKSTLAKNINALLLPSSGAVYVNGFDTRKEEQVWDVRTSKESAPSPLRRAETANRDCGGDCHAAGMYCV